MRRDLYDREGGLSVGDGLMVVYGVRRVGKTSLVMVGLSESGSPYLFIDLRRYMVQPGVFQPWILAGLLEELVAGRLSPSRYLGVESMDIRVLRMRPRRRGRPMLSDALERADRWAADRGARLAIVLDEAQSLNVIPAWRGLMGWAIDALRRVTIIVTGSEVGVLRDFLGLDDPGSPVFGRPRLEIALKPFTKNLALGFLRRGFGEFGHTPPEDELGEAVEKLDGIVGWLTPYGHYRVRYGLGHREALEKVEAEAVKLLSKELEKLVVRAPRRYLAILRAVSLGLERWSDIKRYAEGVCGPIPDPNFNRLLQNLVRYGFVERVDQGYRAVDPLTPKAVELLRRRYGS